MIVIKTRQPDPELEQKIRMLLEREHIETEQISIDSWEKLVLPGLTLDGTTHEVSCNGRKVSLTRLEFDLLLMLASHERQIFSKEELFRAVWGQNCDDTLKVVANTVSNLRKKLAGCGSFIRTTHGGYKTARQMTRLDYARYDHLIGMDESNLCDILRIVGGDPQHKVSLLMAHTDHPREVADPWFTGDFEATWQDILEGCTALLEELR